jgi:hypothetical protein
MQHKIIYTRIKNQYMFQVISKEFLCNIHNTAAVKPEVVMQAENALHTFTDH